MNFADQPKSYRYDVSASLTVSLLKALESYYQAAGVPLTIQSTTGGGIEDISGHDAVFIDKTVSYSVQVSVRPTYNSQYRDLLWERWEYPDDVKVPGRSQHYQFDWWYHFVKEAGDNKEFTFYGIPRQQLLVIVSMADKFGPMQGTCTKKFVPAKPGDPAKDLYCINPTKIFAVSGRVSIE